MLKIVFFGTPEFSVPSLELLLNSKEMEIIAVVTQPDRPVGRKQIITPPPIKELALKHGIPVFQPEKLSSDMDLLENLRKLKPDCLVTVAYGQILKANYLNLSLLGVINLHASLLPKYRGPAPINWMLINGEKNIGVSTMLSDEGVDTGAVLLQAEMPLVENENAQELGKRMSEFGAELLYKTLAILEKDLVSKQSSLQAQAQIDYEELATSEKLAPFLNKNLGYINFSDLNIDFSSPNPKQSFFQYSRLNSAENIHNLILGTYPWPGAYFMINADKITVLQASLPTKLETDSLISELPESAAPGTIVKVNHKEGFIWVQTQNGILQIDKLKPSGKNEMKASDCLNGFRLREGDRI